jgi:two-component system cell cycle response regulator DivK
MSNARRILLVEDDRDNYDLVCILLEHAGHHVLGARTGQEALELARSELPDLVLMDLSLPIMDGWTAARELKLDPRTASIPLLALTAHTLPGDRQRALDAGFNGYISKPINVQHFNEELDKILNARAPLPPQPAG